MAMETTGLEPVTFINENTTKKAINIEKSMETRPFYFTVYNVQLSLKN